MQVTLTNDFHNTSVVVRPKSLFLSSGQRRRAWSALCGIKGCTCSGILGTRGYQEHAIIGEQQEYDSATGELVPSVRAA